MEFQNKIAGGARGIGKTIADEFKKNGATVCMIDILPNDYFQGDIADESVLISFVDKVTTEHGRVDYLINNALPPSKGIVDCSFDEFNYALRVGITAPFYLTKLLAPHFAPGAAVVNISSTRSSMSQPQTESYTAAKGGISALTHALAVSLAGKVRVNSVSPGWIDTAFHEYQGADALQHPIHRVGNPLDIANMVLFLCSDKAGFITGEDICIDGGMTRQMIYSGDHGWTFDGNAGGPKHVEHGAKA
ncbi:MAG: SDR family oxidoreductase [Defluviitaleaceae bacterium]|nr:SDR family oxidoreductase [Defluviitaleaceae bacterium]